MFSRAKQRNPLCNQWMCTTAVTGPPRHDIAHSWWSSQLHRSCNRALIAFYPLRKRTRTCARKHTANHRIARNGNGGGFLD
jgi:hypothetical protein